MKPKFKIGNYVQWYGKTVRGVIAQMDGDSYYVKWEDSGSGWYSYGYDRDLLIAFGYNDFLDKINDRIK